jgi:hypothetical protein
MRLRVRRRLAWVYQRWALAAMERNLRVSEPRLMAMFTMFTWLASDEAPSGHEAMSQQYRRRRRPRLWPYALVACVTVALVGIGVGLPNTGNPSCELGGFTSPASGATSSGPATCPQLQPRRAAIPEPGGR